MAKTTSDLISKRKLNELKWSSHKSGFYSERIDCSSGNPTFKVANF